MQRLAHHRFRRTTLMTAAYAGFLVGIGVAYWGYTINLDWLGLFAALLVIFRKRTVTTLVLVVLLGMTVGLWRGALFQHKLTVNQSLYGQKITIMVRASEDAVYNQYSQLAFNANHAYAESQPLAGKISVSGFGLNSVLQGDEVRATGKLYPGFGSYQGRMSYAQLELVRHRPSLIASLRRNFAAGMQSALPEPVASFAMGLLIGQRATLPDDIKRQLLMVGLTHIIAVSGYNLTIMLRASRGILAGQSKRLSLLFCLGLIGSFVLLTGASASINRAAIVSLLSIAAGYYGRSFKPINLILLAAAITAWANPFYLWGDASWYLSFLAFYGVMVLAPAIALRLHMRWQRSLVAMVALESVCAEIMTIPYILHTFGQISFIGLPANVLVVTLVPLAMLLSLFAGLAGMIMPALAGWLAWPASWLLSYMLNVAHLLSRLPNIFVENIGLGTGQMLMMYVAISLVSASLRFKNNSKTVKITDKNQFMTEGLKA